MKRFESFKELLSYAGVNSHTSIIACKEELSNFLGCEGSTIVNSSNEEPDAIFEIELSEGIKMTIGITSISIGDVEDEEWKFYYWLEI